MNTLDLSKQNDRGNIELLRASTIAYTRAKSGEIKITYFLLFLSLAYPLCYLFIKNENFKLALFCCSFVLTILVQIFTTKFKGNTSKGAVFKEEFDTIIFNLPWISTLKKPDREEVARLSNQYKGAEIRDWYSPNLSQNIAHNTAVAILQQLNSSWDFRLRKTYRKKLVYFLIFYSVILSTVFIVKNVDLLTIFLLLFSLLSFYTYFISLIRGHNSAINKREFISKYLDEIIYNKKIIGINELRDIQDEIYYTRQEAAKVPNFFFQFYKEDMNLKAEEYIAEVNNLYK